MQDKGLKFMGSGEARYTRLSTEEESDAINAIKLLEVKFPGDSLKLTDAVIFYAGQYNGSSAPKLDDAIEKWITGPRFVRNTKKHQDQCKYRIQNFRKCFNNLKLDQFTSKQIEKHVFDENRDVSDGERGHQYACVNTFFNFAVKEGWLTSNPCSKVYKPKGPKKTPVALSIPEVKTLMEWAEKVDGGSMVPYFALGIFSALRPSEIKGTDETPPLDWSDFVWDDEVPCVTIDGKGSTQGGNKRRSVDLHPTCIAWIKPYAKDSGQVAPETLTRKHLWHLIRGLAGYRVTRKRVFIKNRNEWASELEGLDLESEERSEWEHDVMRHTGITYYHKLKQNKHLVAEWAGNTPTVMNQSYRVVKGVTQGTCDEFWNILPESDFPARKAI